MTAMDVRSFRACFDLERRIHRIDRWRLPVPWGIPLRGVVYALVALVAMFAAGAVPGLGLVVGALPDPLRFAILPVGLAVVLVRWRVDGRPAHAALAAVLRWRCQPREHVGARRRGRRTRPGLCRYAPVAFARDASVAGTRRGRVVGPVEVGVRGRLTRSRRGRLRLSTTGQGGESHEVRLAAGEVLEVQR